ncbi:hypothetical protein ACFWAY_47665 [Rhodococcus sp. NPDC059968]
MTCGNAAFRHYIYASLGGVLVETDLYECAAPGCPSRAWRDLRTNRRPTA